MVKHLHFNPTNFNQLILSGLLIETYKDDIECHPSEQTQELKFIQGLNVVENTIEGILKFANADCRKKYFGLNAQQQAVINMVNGVCKDIDTKLASVESVDEIKEKVGHLNEFWASPSSQWLKHKFYYCHMNILTLSFRVQDQFPEILIKYPVFVELRKLFISDKWLSKKALVSMFANPCNAYQEFDLFPEAQGECSLRSSFGVPAQSGEEESKVQQIEENFVEIQAVEIPDGSEMDESKSYHQKQKVEQRFTESQIQKSHDQVESQISENEFRDINSDISKIKTEQKSRVNGLEDEDRFQTLAAESKIMDTTHHSQQTYLQMRTQNQSDPNQVVGSNVPAEGSAMVGDLVSEIRSDVENNVKAHEQIKDSEKIRVDQTMNESSEANQKKMDSSENDGSNKMKKSLKESFSQNFTKPLEYSTKSLTDKDDKSIKAQQTQKHEQRIEAKHQENHDQNHMQVKKAHEQEKKQVKVDEKHHERHENSHKKEEHAVQLKKQVIIDQAQSEKYISQQQFDHQEPQTDTHKVQAQQQPQQVQTKTQPAQAQRQVNPQQVRAINKPPQSESLASQKGPKTNMQQSIKPREEVVQKQKESCKCEIY